MSEVSKHGESAPATSGSRRETIFESAGWYDRSVNWAARLGREIPVLCEVFGRPGEGGLLDAGCGTGHQAVALAQRGYAVTGADASAEMLEVARGHASREGAHPRFVCCPYDALTDRLDAGFDGVMCIGNSLAAAGSAGAIERAVANFGSLLRPGGRLFVQVLNFPPLRLASPCVRGPRVSVVDGVEYVSVRCFDFRPDPQAGPQGCASVTNVTLWNDGAWHKRCHSGTLYPLTREELTTWCARANLTVLNVYGLYDRTPFDPKTSIDVILIAERKP